MDDFIPFGVSKTAQDIITEHLNTPKTPSTDVFRNPNYDLRTEQGLPLDALYPNPLLDTTPPTDAPVDPCPPGYMLVDGICQPIEQFGQSSYQQDNDRDDPEERPYMSIEDMKNASDEELLEYLKDGRLSNSALGFLPSKGNLVTLKKSQFMPPLFKLAFGGQDKMREEFMLSELMKRGYFTGNFDKNQNPIFDIGNKNVNTNTGGIESALPQNVQGQPVTDVYGDTYQQIANNQGNTGYTFTSGNPQDQVGQATQSGVIYGVGRGGGQSPSGTGTPVNYSQTGNPFLTQPPQMTAAQQQYMEDYDK